MSEDYDDITNGSISIDRAKHHCGRLAVDCGWRAVEVEMHIDAQAKIIAVLRAEVKAWRNADTWHDLIWYMKEDTDHSHASEVEEAMARTDALEPIP